MPYTNDPWRWTPEDLSTFGESVEKTFRQFGAVVTSSFDEGATRRVHLQDIDAYLDITMGPGGNPIVGRGGGWYVPPQLSPRFDPGAGALVPETIGAWDVLGKTVQQAVASAKQDVNPAKKFGNALSYAFGAGVKDEGGWGAGAQWLDIGWQRSYPAPALQLLSESFAAPSGYPAGATSKVYPGYVMMTQGEGGFHRAVPGTAFTGSGISGAGLAGGAGKQQGRQMYAGGQLGDEPTVRGSYAGGTMEGQILDVAFPLHRAVSTVEGQALVQMGSQLSVTQPHRVPLAGWTIEQLEQVGGVSQGYTAMHGAQIPLITSREGEVLYGTREQHWSRAQVSSAYISLPQVYEQTPWYQGLSDMERNAFRIEGGGVAKGLEVPSLVYEMQLSRGAGGSGSGKGASFKNLFAERDLQQMFTAGLSPAEISGLGIAYQEPPKDWLTNLYTVGVGLGLMERGQSFYSGGQLNQELIGSISTEMAKHTKSLTTREVVSMSQGAAYLGGDVPGVTAKTIDGGLVELQRTEDWYVGPKFEINRLEYPHGRSVYSGEEMEHYRQVNPELYNRLQEIGQQPTAHQNIMRSYWASYGKYDLPTTPYAEVQGQIDQMLATATPWKSGDLVKAMADNPEMANLFIQSQGGVVLPSARDIRAMSATNLMGEEVGQLVKSWEYAVSSSSFGGYQGAAEQMIGQQNFIKSAQELDVPGAMGPGTASSGIAPGQVLIGREQFHQMARQFYGRNPTEEQLAQLEATVRAESPTVQYTRFPHADPFTQQDVFLQLGLGWGPGADVAIGAEEISTNPYHSQEQHGDQDADLYRVTLLSLTQSAGGISSVDMSGTLRNARQQLESMVQQMRLTSPEAVQEAEKNAAVRTQSMLDSDMDLSQLEMLRLGDVVRGTRDFASEMYKHAGKELTDTDLTPAEWIRAQATGKVPSIGDSIEKYENAWASKGMMGRSYNALIRDIGMQARNTLGPEAAQQIMSIGHVGYQRALDTGFYEGGAPLGRGEAGEDPRISFGMARLLETWGSQSFLYGGGFAESITGEASWSREKEEYTAPWHKVAKGVSPWFTARQQMGQIGMFMTEGTPEQIALGMTGETSGDLTQAIRTARDWVTKQEGMTAQQMMSGDEGRGYMNAILEAAGMSTDAGLLNAQGMIPQAAFAMMGVRTREQVARDPSQRRELTHIAEQYEAMTGRSLYEEMGKAANERGGIEALSGRMGSLGARDMQSAILALADVLPGPLTEGVVEGPISKPTQLQDVWASSMGMDDWKRFGAVLSRANKGRWSQGWGQAGTKAHGEFEEQFAGDESIFTEAGAHFRGRVSAFGVEEFGDVGISAKPDIVKIQGDEITVFDIKTYGLDQLDPSQLLFYGAAMEKKFEGKRVTRMAYLRQGEGVDQELLRKIVNNTASPEELEGARNAGILREVEVPADIQATAGGLIRENLQQEQQLTPLLAYLSDYELESNRVGLEGGYTQYTDTVKHLYSVALQNKAMGVKAGASAYGDLGQQSPVERVGNAYGIDLTKFGVRGARIMSPRDFLADRGIVDAESLTDQAVDAKLSEMNDIAGYQQGDKITVRQFTPSEILKMGDKWNPYTQMRGRLVHEAAHVQARHNPALLTLAEEEVGKMASDDPFIQGVKALYPDTWKQEAASELIAHRMQQRFGATVGPLDREGLSALDEAIVRIAGGSDISGTGGGFYGGEGGGGEGDIHFMAAPGRGGGGFNMTPEEFASQVQKAMAAAQQLKYNEERDLRWTKETAQAAFSIMGTPEQAAGVFDRPEVQALTSGDQWARRQYGQLLDLQKYAEKGGPASGQVSNIFGYMAGLAGTANYDVHLGMPGQLTPTMERFAGIQVAAGQRPGEERAAREQAFYAEQGVTRQQRLGAYQAAGIEQEERVAATRQQRLGAYQAEGIAEQERITDTRQQRYGAYLAGGIEEQERIAATRQQRLGAYQASGIEEQERISTTRQQRYGAYLAEGVEEQERIAQVRQQRLGAYQAEGIAQQEQVATTRQQRYGAYLAGGVEQEMAIAETRQQRLGAYQAGGIEQEERVARTRQERLGAYQAQGVEQEERVAATRQQRLGAYMAEGVAPFQKLNETLETTVKNMKALSETSENLSKGQREELEKIAKAPLGRAFADAFRAGGADFLESAGAKEAMGLMDMGGDGDGGWWEKISGGRTPGEWAKGTAKKAVSGMNMFAIRRMWNIAGGPQIAAEQVAAQQEMAAQGAVSQMYGGGQMGGVAGGLVGMQNIQQNAQASMGRGAWGAYGGIQQAMAGTQGELAGVLGPAIGVGAAIGMTAGPAFGVAAGVGAAAIGFSNYFSNTAQDSSEMAYLMGADSPKELGFGGLMKLGGAVASQSDSLPSLIRNIMSVGGDTDMRARGALMRSGDVGVLGREDQTRALRGWAEQQSNIMSETQWMQTAGQWQSYTGTVENLGELPVELMEQMAVRGIDTSSMAEMAFNIGGTTGNIEGISQAISGAANPAAAQRALGQYAIAGQVGMIDPGRLAGMTGQLEEMTGFQERRFGAMIGGDRGLWSRYGRGEDVGLPQDAIDMLAGQFGGPAPWQITTQEGGLEMFTTGTEGYAGPALMSTAAQGGFRGIQRARMDQQNQMAIFQEGQQRNQFQMGYTYTTGGRSADLAGGAVAPGLAAMSAEVGGMWGLQDTRMNAQFANQMGQADYGLQMMDVRDQQFQFNWQTQRDRMDVRKGWDDEGAGKTDERNEAADAWQLFKFDYKSNRQDIQFGRQMEDLDEGIRFATGREKLSLMKAKERATVDYSMEKGYAEEERSNWEQQKEWRDEDIEDAKEKREIVQQWAEEDLERSKKDHDEIAGLERAHATEQKRFAQEMQALQKQEVALQREYWKEGQKAQAEQIERSQEYAELQRAMREDEMNLLIAREDHLARFASGMSKLGETLAAALKAAGVKVDSSEPKFRGGGPQEGTGTEDDPDPKTVTDVYGPWTRHQGGPVGMMPGTGGSVAITAQEGEYVVPSNGQLVFRDDERVVNLLASILGALNEGNGRITMMSQGPSKTAEATRSVTAASYAQ